MNGSKSGKRRFRHSGFSLLELLVVMAIAGLLLTLVPPLVGNALAGTEIRMATRELAAALKTARARAVATQQEYVLTIDVGNRTYRLPGEPRTLLPASVAITLTTAESERLDDNTGNIRFFPDGSSTGGRIALGDDSLKFIIDVDWLTGKVSIDS